MQDPTFIGRLVELGMQNPNDEILGSVASSVLEQMLQPQDTDAEFAKAMDLIAAGQTYGDQNMIDLGQSILSKFYDYGGTQADTEQGQSLQDLNKNTRVQELSQMVNDPEMAGLRNQYLTELAYLNQAPGMQAPSGSRFYVDDKTKQFGYEPERLGLGDRIRAGSGTSFLQRMNPFAGIQLLLGGDPYGAKEQFRTPIGNANDLDYSLMNQYLSQ